MVACRRAQAINDFTRSGLVEGEFKVGKVKVAKESR